METLLTIMGWVSIGILAWFIWGWLAGISTAGGPPSL